MNYYKGLNNAENVKPHRSNRILKEIMLKILVVGDYGVGKTAIIRRYTEGKFSSNYKITVGADFSIKTIAWDNLTQINMQLWDIAGHEKIGFMTRVYYKYAVAAIIVFDVSRLSTFQSIQKWLNDIRDKVSLSDGSPIPVIILANKCDIPEVSVPIDSLNKLCRQHNVTKWFKTSAKTNINIDEAMMHLVSMALKNKLKGNTQTNDSILLHKNKVNEEEYTCCSDDVRDYILNCDDEPHLSKTQNNYRRIFIASELFTGICTLYSHIVDHEFNKIISDLIQWEKFKNLSRRISHKIQLEARREKYFLKEAQRKLLKTLEDADTIKKVVSGPVDNLEGVPRPVEDTESASRSIDEVEQRTKEDLKQKTVPSEISERKIVTSYEKESPLISMEHELMEYAGKEIAAQTLVPPSESSFRDDSVSSITRIMTDVRAESTLDISRLQYPISTIPQQDLSLPITAAEISVAEPVIQQKSHDDIDQILHILEDQILPKETAEIEKPQTVLEVTDRNIEVSEEASVEKLPDEKQADASEKSESEEWSLPSLEPPEKIRKKHPHLIIDEVTIIPEYAARALQLNRNINIQRVQVYEGPPKILQSISVNHLMTTPGFKSSLFQDTRNLILNQLYDRHLKVEKKPVEPELLHKRTIEKQKEVIPMKRTISEIREDIGGPAGMRSAVEKTYTLIEAAPEKSHHEDLEISIPGILPKESLVGMPMSRIINGTVAPPEEEQMERISAAVLLSPRVQQLQGKRLDRETSPPSWFQYTKENPPDQKYREFNYVYKKLQNYWSLFENQGMEKSISLREFFSFEQNESKANFLLVLRIVDKMSIQRKLVLEYKDHDVLIQPFESPYVSDKQLLLKGKEAIF